MYITWVKWTSKSYSVGGTIIFATKIKKLGTSPILTVTVNLSIKETYDRVSPTLSSTKTELHAVVRDVVCCFVGVVGITVLIVKK